jgi:hypothetical protein
MADPTPSEVEAALAVIEAAAHVHPAATPEAVVVAAAPAVAPAPAAHPVWRGEDAVNFPPIVLEDGTVLHRNPEGAVMLGPTG